MGHQGEVMKSNIEDPRPLAFLPQPREASSAKRADSELRILTRLWYYKILTTINAI